MRIDPQHTAARHDLAALESQAHRPAKALRGLIDAGTLDPGEPAMLRSVADVLWQLSWRVRMGLAVATIAIVAASPADPTVPA